MGVLGGGGVQPLMCKKTNKAALWRPTHAQTVTSTTCAVPHPFHPHHHLPCEERSPGGEVGIKPVPAHRGARHPLNCMSLLCQQQRVRVLVSHRAAAAESLETRASRPDINTQEPASSAAAASPAEAEAARRACPASSAPVRPPGGSAVPLGASAPPLSALREPRRGAYLLILRTSGDPRRAGGVQARGQSVQASLPAGLPLRCVSVEDGRWGLGAAQRRHFKLREPDWKIRGKRRLRTGGGDRDAAPELPTSTAADKRLRLARTLFCDPHPPG